MGVLISSSEHVRLLVGVCFCIQPRTSIIGSGYRKQLNPKLARASVAASAHPRVVRAPLRQAAGTDKQMDHALVGDRDPTREIQHGGQDGDDQSGESADARSAGGRADETRPGEAGAGGRGGPLEQLNADGRKVGHEMEQWMSA